MTDAMRVQDVRQAQRARACRGRLTFSSTDEDDDDDEEEDDDDDDMYEGGTNDEATAARRACRDAWRLLVRRLTACVSPDEQFEVCKEAIKLLVRGVGK